MARGRRRREGRCVLRCWSSRTRAHGDVVLPWLLSVFCYRSRARRRLLGEADEDKVLRQCRDLLSSSHLPPSLLPSPSMSELAISSLFDVAGKVALVTGGGTGTLSPTPHSLPAQQPQDWGT